MREYMYPVRSEGKKKGIKKLPAATIRFRRLLTYIRCMMLIETLCAPSTQIVPHEAVLYSHCRVHVKEVHSISSYLTSG